MTPPVTLPDMPLWLPPLIACGISFCTSMCGISGAFILLPVQMFCFGTAHPSLSATNHLFNIMAIPAGIYRYWRERRIARPLTAALAIGTLPGALLGAAVRTYWLPDAFRFKLFAAAVLVYLGLDLIMGRTRRPIHQTTSARDCRVHTCTPAQLLSLGTVGCIVGLIAGAYGIGGGSIITTLLISRFRFSLHAVAGTTLAVSFVTSAIALVIFQIIAIWEPTTLAGPNWTLGLLLGCGGMIGMYCGARCQKFLASRALHWLLAGCIFIMAALSVITTIL